MQVPRMLIGWMGLGLLVLSTAVGCTNNASVPIVPNTGGGLKRIVFLTNTTNSPYWSAARVGMLEADRDLNLNKAGLQAAMVINDGTPEGQIELLRKFASDPDVVAVGLSAVDAAN